MFYEIITARAVDKKSKINKKKWNPRDRGRFRFLSPYCVDDFTQHLLALTGQPSFLFSCAPLLYILSLRSPERVDVYVYQDLYTYLSTINNDGLITI